jgi:excinuclease Cho
MSTETCTDTAGDASVGLPDSSGAGAAIGVAANVLQPGIGQAMLTCTDETLDRAPHCPGVYRFFNDKAALLYIGKSVDIASRVRSHFADAREPGRQQRMMSAVRRIDCQPTAGELGALLIENAAIKTENPLYNRRQRRARRLWTIRLGADIEGFLRVMPADFCPNGERNESVFGLYRSKHHLERAIGSLAREQRLCLRMLGLERGRGPCFQSQVGRCAGACAGRENAAAHNARLLAALEAQRIAAWPFDTPVLLHEVLRDEHRVAALPAQPRRHYHLVYHWAYLGSFTRRDSARRAAAADGTHFFDRDAYRILLAALLRDRCEILDADGAPLANPLRADAS